MERYASDPQESTKISEPDLAGSYTGADYLTWTFEGLVELIGGRIFKMSPAPTTIHQRASMTLSGIFYNFFFDRPCDVFAAPTDVYFVGPGEDIRAAKNIVQPDLIVVCEPGKIHRIGCIGAPDLVVEIISPSSSKKDIELKFRLYEQFGVKEYWIADPDRRTVSVHVLDGIAYASPLVYHENEYALSRLFPDLLISVSDLFKGTENIPA